MTSEELEQVNAMLADRWLDLEEIPCEEDQTSSLELSVYSEGNGKEKIGRLSLRNIDRITVKDTQRIAIYDVNKITWDARGGILTFHFNIPARLQIQSKTLSLEYIPMSSGK